LPDGPRDQPAPEKERSRSATPSRADADGTAAHRDSRRAQGALNGRATSLMAGAGRLGVTGLDLGPCRWVILGAGLDSDLAQRALQALDAGPLPRSRRLHVRVVEIDEKELAACVEQDVVRGEIGMV